MKGVTLKTITIEAFFEKLESMGLQCNHKSGGAFYPNSAPSKIKKIQDNHFNLVQPSGEISVLVDPGLFHHSVMSAEATMDIKFFS